jgi:hypothetical protein
MQRPGFVPAALVLFFTSSYPLALPTASELVWKEVLLVHDRNEGMALADVDRDGSPDLIAGAWWYRAPSWEKRPLRDLKQDREFAHNNGDLALDVDGDGWVDVISGSWFSPEIYWYRNPGKEGLERGEKWQATLIGRVRSCEAKFLHDFDGDGLPELVCNSWEARAPVVVFRLTRGPEGPRFEEHQPGGSGSGHGMGIGDLNGDGRADVVTPRGWYEVPPEPFARQPWAFHSEFKLGDTSTPVAIHDVNGDRLADIVYGQGHDYRLRWLEQTRAENGARSWKEHLIDEKLSQAHTIAVADLDGDRRPDFITGKRLRGHGDRDPGSHDAVGLYYYTWSPSANRFEKRVIRELEERPAVGTGMQIIVHDLDRDGRPDIAVAGKSGTFILLNQPPTAQ